MASLMDFLEQRRQSYVGQKFILRSNENEPIKVGTLMGWESLKSSHLPIVEVDGETLYVFSIMIPYTKVMEDLLNSMTPREGYDLLKDIKMWWSESK
jgi:hypothetical protein